MNQSCGIVGAHIESPLSLNLTENTGGVFQSMTGQFMEWLTTYGDKSESTWSFMQLASLTFRFMAWFLVWTFCEYATHRWLFHYNHTWNPFFKIHQFHHGLSLESLCAKENRFPKPLYFLWFFDNVYETLEIVIGETIWALLIYLIDPEVGVPLLIFHYVYELLATDSLLEHNADLEAPIGLAVGKFHLEHHAFPTCNYGFTIDLWDRLLGTWRESKDKKYL